MSDICIRERVKVFVLFWSSCLVFYAQAATEWNSSVFIPDVQYSLVNLYENYTEVALKNAYYAGGFVYYAASASTSSSSSPSAIFTKENATDLSIVWSKAYSNFNFFHRSFIVANDGSSIFWIENGNSASFNMIKINPDNGELLNHYSA